LFAEYGLPVSKGFAVGTLQQEAAEACDKIGGDIVGRQGSGLHAGGRGKAGGVKLIKKQRTEANGVCEKWLGQPSGGPIRQMPTVSQLTRSWFESCTTSLRNVPGCGCGFAPAVGIVFRPLLEVAWKSKEVCQKDSPRKSFKAIVDPLVGRSLTRALTLHFNLRPERRPIKPVHNIFVGLGKSVCRLRWHCWKSTRWSFKEDGICIAWTPSSGIGKTGNAMCIARPKAARHARSVTQDDPA